MRQRLQALLNQIIQQTAADSTAQQQVSDASSTMEMGLVYVGAFMMGGLDMATDLWSFINVVDENLAKMNRAYLGILADLFRGDAKAIQQKLQTASDAGLSGGN